MNLVLNLCVCALSVSVGILLYDTFKGDPPVATVEFLTAERGTPSEVVERVKARGAGFDEASLRTIRLYVDEMNRRKSEERERGRLEGELERVLGPGLLGPIVEALVDQFLLYQRRAQDIKEGDWSPDEHGGTALRGALLRLREEYAAVLHAFVPADDVEKILQSRLTRLLGLPEISSAEDEK